MCPSHRLFCGSRVHFCLVCSHVVPTNVACKSWSVYNGLLSPASVWSHFKGTSHCLAQVGKWQLTTHTPWGLWFLDHLHSFVCLLCRACFCPASGLCTKQN